MPDQELENHIERIACLRAGDNDADLRIIYGRSDGQLRDGWQQGEEQEAQQQQPTFLQPVIRRKISPKNTAD